MTYLAFIRASNRRCRNLFFNFFNLSVAFCKWTVLSAFCIAIWYYPLWALGFTGYEACILCFFSVFFLSYSRKIANSRISSLLMILFGMILPSQLSLLGQSLQPYHRLFMLSFAVSIISMQFSVGHEPLKTLNVDSKYAGLILSVILKFAYQSHNPAWPVMKPGVDGHPVIYGVLGMLCVLLKGHSSAAKSTLKSKNLITGLGFGGLLYLSLAYLNDAELAGRWLNTGLPNHGPSSIFCGFMVISSMIASINLRKFRSNLSVLSLIAFISFYFLKPYSPMTAFLCFLCSAVHLGQNWSVFTGLINQENSKSILSVSMTFFLLLVFGQVYTVAYAFVPMGEYMREKSWLVMLSAHFAVSLCALQGGFYGNERSRKFSDKDEFFTQKKSPKPLSVFFIVILVLALVSRLSKPLYLRKPYTPIRAPVSNGDELPVITAAIWNIHHFLDSDMYSSHSRIKKVLEKASVDVIGFLESDTMRLTTGNRDAVQYLGEELNMYVDYGISTRDHTWGCAMLSRYPIIKSVHHLLPSPEGELACAIHATIKVGGQLIDVLVAHNGQEETELDRVLQTKESAKIIQESSNPLIYLGYVTAAPHSRNYYMLFKRTASPENDETFDFVDDSEGAIFDIDPSYNKRWCQYVGYKGPGLARLSFHKINYGTISDTELEIGKFIVYPRGGEGQVTKLREMVGTDDEYFKQWFMHEDFRNGWNGHGIIYERFFWKK